MGTLTNDLLNAQKINDWFSGLSNKRRDELCDEYEFPKYSSGNLHNWMVKHIYQNEVL